MSPLEVTPDMILTSAIEAGIGIVGFTGLIISLTRSRDALVANLLSMLIIAPSMVVVLSFLPLVLATIGIEESLIWQLASGVMVIYFVAVSYRRQRVMRDIDVDEGQRENVKAFLVLVVCSAVLAILQIVNIVLWQTAWPFLAYIVFYVLFCLVIFGRLVMSVWNDDS